MIIKEHNKTIEEIIIENFNRHNVPSAVEIDLTNRCNCKCIFCFHGDTHENIKKELSFHEIKMLLIELQTMGVRTITYLGGEPFIRVDIIEILRLSRKMGFRVNIITNGFYLNEKNIKEITKIHLSNITISIHSLEKENNDYHFGVSDSKLSSVLKNLELMVALGINVSISISVTKHNIHELSEMFQKFTNMGVKPNNIFFNRLFPGKSQIDDIIPLESDKLRYLSNHPELIKNFTEVPKGNRNGLLCDAGISKASINYYGDVKPCGIMSASGGNIRENSFQYIWNNSELFQLARNIKEIDFLKCKDCNYNENCSICYIENILTTGSIYNPNEKFCSKIHEIKKLEEKNDKP